MHVVLPRRLDDRRGNRDVLSAQRSTQRVERGAIDGIGLSVANR
jgi:hypothetical protein